MLQGVDTYMMVQVAVRDMPKAKKPMEAVLPLTMVENSTFLPTHLTFPLGPVYLSLQELCISNGEDCLAFQVFLYLLVFFLLLPLAWLFRLSLLHHDLPCSRAGAMHPVIHR